MAEVVEEVVVDVEEIVLRTILVSAAGEAEVDEVILDLRRRRLSSMRSSPALIGASPPTLTKAETAMIVRHRARWFLSIIAIDVSLSLIRISALQLVDQLDLACFADNRRSILSIVDQCRDMSANSSERSSRFLCRGGHVLLHVVHHPVGTKIGILKRSGLRSLISTVTKNLEIFVREISSGNVAEAQVDSDTQNHPVAPVTMIIIIITIIITSMRGISLAAERQGCPNALLAQGQ